MGTNKKKEHVMKTKLMYVAVCLLFTSVLFASGGKGKGVRKGFKGERKGRSHLDMSKNLELTAEQKVQTDKMSKEFHGKAKEIRNGDLERPKKREAIMEHRKNLEKNIDSVLTPEQKEKAQQNRQERKQLRKQNREKNRKVEKKQNKQCVNCPTK